MPVHSNNNKRERCENIADVERDKSNCTNFYSTTQLTFTHNRAPQTSGFFCEIKTFDETSIFQLTGSITV